MTTQPEALPPIVPESLPAEMSVIGSMMMQKYAIEKASAIVREADFYREAHQVIFSAIMSLYQQGSPVDLTTLPEYLRDKKILEVAGGLPYLASLLNKTPSPANVEYYARIVLEKSRARQLLMLSAYAERAVYDAKKPLSEIIEILNTSLIAIKPVQAVENPLPEMQQIGIFLDGIGTPPPMLVDRIIPDRGLILITGKPKHAKSYFAMDILDSISQAQPVLQQLGVSRTGPVLYLAMEDGPYETANRLLKRGIRAKDTRPFYLSTGRMDLSKPESIAHLHTLLDQVKPILLCIDTAREGCGIKDWTDPSEVSDKIRPLRDMARERCSIILVAHNRKSEGINGDEISGTNALTSSVDGWISIQRKEALPGGNLRLWATVDGRAGMRGDLVVEMDTHNLHFRMVTDEEQKAERDQSKASERDQREAKVYLAIAEAGGRATTVQISDRTAFGYETTKALVREMFQSGKLREDGKIASNGGRAATAYAVTSGNLPSTPRNNSELPEVNPFLDNTTGEERDV